MRSPRTSAGGAAGQAGPDAGAVALELVVIAPVLISIVLLMLGYGRQAQVGGLVEAAARDGARAATQARSYDDAVAVVGRVVADTLRAAPASCAGSAASDVGDPVAFIPGAAVTVEVSCDLAFADVGLPLPTRPLRRSFTSTLDPYRGVR